MRRWGRILFNTLTAISLLLVLAIAVLWVRSYWRQDCVAVGRFSLCSGKGRLLLTRNYFPFYADLRPHWESDPDLDAFDKIDWMWFRSLGRASRPVHQLVFPLWVLLALAGGSFIIARRQSRQPPPGQCPHCGYDTRANLARCSECGHELQLAEDNEGERFTSDEARR